LRYPIGEAGGEGVEPPARVFTILLVEDNRSDAFIIREILRRRGLDAGLQVITDGDLALKFWDRVENDGPCPDLVLLDLNLPKLSGIQVLQRIRGAKRCQNVPVVIVSSSKSPADVASAEALGVSVYFQKSTDLAAFMELGAVVAGLLPQGGEKV
jgi:CheY-like chemotaxis protein